MDLKTAVAAAAGAAVGAGLCYLAVSHAYSSTSNSGISGGGDSGLLRQPDQPSTSSHAYDAGARVASASAAAGEGGGPTVERYWEDDILAEHLTRNVQFFGQEGQMKVSAAFVVVVGLGVSGGRRAVGPRRGQRRLDRKQGGRQHHDGRTGLCRPVDVLGAVL